MKLYETHTNIYQHVLSFMNMLPNVAMFYKHLNICLPNIKTTQLCGFIIVFTKHMWNLIMLFTKTN